MTSTSQFEQRGFGPVVHPATMAYESFRTAAMRRESFNMLMPRERGLPDRSFTLHAK